MIEHKNKKHLTEKDVFLYCDKEMDKKGVFVIEKHLEDCKSCKQLLENTLSFSKMLKNVAKNNLSVNIKNDCLNDMDISAYIDNKVSSEKRIIIEEHLCNCAYCLNIMAETKTSLEDNVIQKDIQPPIENIWPVVMQKLRKQTFKSLTQKFKNCYKKSPHNVQNYLGKINKDIENILKKTFTYPSHRFAPVFGEHKSKYLSPFGKVRFPVVFEWLPYKDTDKYIISIEGVNWSISTNESRLRIESKDLKLEYGKEYMWELKIINTVESEEKTGFFTIAAKDEIKELLQIEKQFKDIVPSQDRYILWATILEEREFYLEAIEHYKKSYELESSECLAYRIAYCYNELELEELKGEWNKKIK